VESKAAQYAVGAMGMPALTSVLRDERQDVELAHGVLEVLVNAITAGGGGGGGGGGEGGGSGDGSSQQQEDGAHRNNRGVGARSGPGAANAEALARNPANVELLLSLLDESDFYIRYHTVQLLTAGSRVPPFSARLALRLEHLEHLEHLRVHHRGILSQWLQIDSGLCRSENAEGGCCKRPWLTALSATNAHQVQEAIMSNPMGVGRLMDMMVGKVAWQLCAAVHEPCL